MYWMYCLCIRVHNTFAIRQQIWEHFLAQTQFLFSFKRKRAWSICFSHYILLLLRYVWKKRGWGGGGWPNFKLFWSTWDPLSSRKALADKNEAIKCGVWPLSSLHTALLIADWLRQLWYYPIKGQEWEKIYTKMQHRENGRWEEFNAKYFIRKNGERAKCQWLNLFAISIGCINKYHHSIGAHFLCAIFLLVV